MSHLGIVRCLMTSKYYGIASFRGIEFEYLEDEYTFTRKEAEQDYIGSSDNSSESMGDEPRVYNIKGFVQARNYKDYSDKRDNLRIALEKDGVGTLAHPHYGTRKVKLSKNGYVCRNSFDKGFYADFEMTFIEATDAVSKLKILPVSAEASKKIQEAAEKAKTDFVASFLKKYDVSAKPQWVADSAANSVGIVSENVSALSSAQILPFSQASSIIGSAGNLKSSATTITSKPSSLASSLQNLLSSANSVVGTSSSNSSTSSSSLYSYATYKAISSDVAVETVTPKYLTATRVQEIANTEAINNLVTQTSTVNAAVVAANDDYSSSVAIADRIDDLTNMVETEQLKTDDAEVQSSLEDVLITAVSIIKEKTPIASTNITTSSTLPAVVIAQNSFGGSDYISIAENLVSTNKIANPLFVGGGQNLEVITDV